MLARKELSMRRAPAPLLICAFVLSAATLSGQAAIPAAEPGKCSVIWTGVEDQIEKLLTEGKIGKMEAVPIGVTKPERGTIDGTPIRFAWKALRPGYSKGFMESYKAEIAAYKLDRMLEMHMVPPIVERKIEGQN